MAVKKERTVRTTTSYRSGSVLLVMEEADNYTQYRINMNGVNTCLGPDEMKQLVEVVEMLVGEGVEG